MNWTVRFNFHQKITIAAVLVFLVIVQVRAEEKPDAGKEYETGDRSFADLQAGEKPQWWIDSMKTHDQRMAWWRQARFGMFVHWGVSAHLGGVYGDRVTPGYAEHIQRSLRIPIPDYLENVAGKFNPTGFNADEWIRLARDTGMSYYVITAKHHDGFAMWPSKVSPHNIVDATPFGRDPMAELKAACKKYGLKFGFYYSHAFDWGEPNGPGNDWDYDNPGGDKNLHGGLEWWKHSPELLPKIKSYVDEKAIPQLLELIEMYDPDILWFDTPHKLPPWENLRLMEAVRKASPRVVINGRLIDDLGDYVNTADGPKDFLPTPGDWEAIPTTNNSYGWHQKDMAYKPASHFIQLVAKAAARGGNVLLNVGPRGDGRIDPRDVEIFNGIGAWWKVNGESIRGTQRTPLSVQTWGESTRKGDTLYLHVFNWPGAGRLTVGGIQSEILEAALLTASGPVPLKAAGRTEMDVTLEIPAQAPDPVDSVIRLECKGPLTASPRRLLFASLPEDTLRGIDGVLNGGLKFNSGRKSMAHVFNWTLPTDSIQWPIRLAEKTTFEVAVSADADKEMLENAFLISIGEYKLRGAVKPDRQKRISLGRVTLPAGEYEIDMRSDGEIRGKGLLKFYGLEFKRTE